MKKNKLAFDFVCDEAPLFGLVGRQLEREGYRIGGLTMGRRWKSYWEGFKTHQVLIPNSTHTDIQAGLRDIEEKYGIYFPTSFPIKDRHLSGLSTQKQYEILVKTFINVEHFLEDFKPDIYISTGVAFLYNLVTFCACSRLNIPHLSFYDRRGTTPRFTFSLGINGHFDFVNLHFAKILSLPEEPLKNAIADSQRQINTFKKEMPKPVYMDRKRQSTRPEGVFVKEFFVRLRRYYLDGWGRTDGSDYMTQHPFFYAQRDLGKLARAKIFTVARARIFDRPLRTERFYLFPLHLQPEASTLIHAPWYVNQLEAVRNLAQCIPADTVLYVKEHPSALGRHPLGFLRALRRIYNVRLLGPWENMRDLIQRSEGVITFTGTAGWESLLLGKPTFVLGDVFYNIIGRDLQVRGFAELRARIAHVRRTGSLNFDPKRVAALYSALDLGSFPGLFDVAKMDTAGLVLDDSNVGLFKAALVTILTEGLVERCADQTMK